MISQQFGLIIKTIRSQKGLGLNEFASRLGVSPAYLSNLENGKTDTVQLKVMDLLGQELQINWSVLLGEIPNGIEIVNHPQQIRLNVALHQVNQLILNNPDAAEFLISSLEAGLAYCISRDPAPNIADAREMKPIHHH